MARFVTADAIELKFDGHVALVNGYSQTEAQPGLLMGGVTTPRPKIFQNNLPDFKYFLVFKMPSYAFKCP